MRAALVALRDVLLFGPLGVLVAAAVGTFAKKRAWWQLIVTLLLAAMASALIALLVRTAFNGTPIRRPSALAIMLILICTTAGSWIGATWYFSRGPLRWVCGQVLLCTAAGAALIAGAFFFGLVPDPADFEPESLDTADRRRLVRLFGKHDPRDISPGAVGTLTLTERDLNQLLTWGLSLGPSGQKARVNLTEEEVQFRSSSKIPWIDRHLNVEAAGMAFVNNGELAVKPKSLRVGLLRVPAWILVASGPSIIDRALQNRHTRPFLSSLKSVELAEGETTVAYGHLEVSDGLLSEALQVLGGRDMQKATAAHVANLARTAEQSTTLSFADCLASAFSEAERRSSGGDAAHENRAAILALGYLIGHPHVKTLVGPKLPRPSQQVREKFRAVKLRGRNDWARHFALSATLEVVSNSATSNMLGLLKEELDADGGSGFSFADLLADKAGTTLAIHATRNEEDARRFQARLRKAFDVNDFFPPARHLPENLTDAEFRAQFGGVGGEEYKRLLAEMEKQIASCSFYSEAG